MKKIVLHVLWVALMLLLGAVLARAESFSGNLIVRPNWTHTKTGLTTASESFGTLFNWTFTSGITTNQMNKLFTAQTTLAGSGTNTFSLAGGVTNTFGSLLTFTNVRMVVVSAAAANAHTISIGGAASQAFGTLFGDSSDKIVVRPGGLFVLVGPDATGYTVSTNGNVQFVNDGTNSVTCNIYIGGS